MPRASDLDILGRLKWLANDPKMHELSLLCVQSGLSLTSLTGHTDIEELTDEIIPTKEEQLKDFTQTKLDFAKETVNGVKRRLILEQEDFRVNQTEITTAMAVFGVK